MFHALTVTAALAHNPMAIVILCLDNPMVILLWLSLSWLIPEVHR